MIKINATLHDVETETGEAVPVAVEVTRWTSESMLVNPRPSFPVLFTPDPSGPFWLVVDGSARAVQP